MRFQTQLYVLNQRVDLLDDLPITLKSKIQDVRDIKKVFVDFSHSFQVPASRTNNRIFGHSFETEGSSIDPREYLEAYIEINNQVFRRGYVLIESGSFKSGRINTYNLRFFSGLVNLSRRLGNDYLSDLDALEEFDLHFDGDSDRDNRIKNLLITDPTDNDNVTICLNAFQEGFYYNSTSDQEIEGYQNIHYKGNSSDDETFNGVFSHLLKPSVRNKVIIESIENKYKGIRFSRGLDANGFPTAIESEVAGGAHLLSRRKFTDTFMLLHTKVEADGLEEQPEERISWDSPWPAITASGPGAFDDIANNGAGSNNFQLIGMWPHDDGSGDHLSSRYYIDIEINRVSGSGAYELELRWKNDVLWSSGVQTQSFRSDEQTSGTYVWQDSVLSGTSYSGGSAQSDPQGQALGGGQPLIFPTEPSDSQEYFLPSFYLKRTDGLEISIPRCSIKNEFRTNHNGPFFGVRDFERNTKISTRSWTVEGTGDSFSITGGVPRIKILDYLTGLWKMFNATAYVDLDANDEELIVVQELDNYYNAGNTYDLTEYVNSQNYKATSPVFYNPIIFKYSDPSTYLAREFFDNQRSNRKFGYGSLSHDSASDPELEDRRLPHKEYKVEVPFEQVVLTPLSDDANRADQRIAYGWIVNDSRRPTAMKPWIHYVENVDTPNGFLYKDGANGNQQIMDYNACTKSLIRDFTEIQSLTFGSEFNERLTNSGTSYATEETLFKEFYQNYITQVFNSKARIYNVKARLPYTIASQLTPADSVVVGNDLFRINSFSINTSNGDSKLELISLNNATPLDPPNVIEYFDELSVVLRQSPEGSIVTDTVTFIATPSGGEGTYTFEWTLNGVTQASTSNTIQLSSLTDGDSVRVSVTSGVELVSQEIIVKVDASPTVSIAATSTGVQTGDSVTFTSMIVDADGDLFNLQWYLDGNAISGAINSSYTVDSWDVSDNGDYTLVVTPITGNVTPVTSNTITLAVSQISASVGTSFNVGETEATLTLIASDGADPSATLNYNWFNQAAPGISLGTSDSITVDTDGTYTVDITSSTGDSASVQTVVDVNNPLMSSLSGPATALPGESITLMISITDTDGDLDSVVVTQDGTEIYNAGAIPAGGELSATGNGVFVLTATDDRGHVATDTITISNSSSAGASSFGAEFFSFTDGGTPSGTSEINTSVWSPSFVAQTSSFTQTQTYNIRTTYDDYVDHYDHTCEVVDVAATGDATQAPCTGGIAFGSTTEKRTANRARAATVGGQQSRTRTAAVSIDTVSALETSVGDQNSDQDTLDTATRARYYVSAVTTGSLDASTSGEHFGSWGVTAANNVTPIVTLSFTAPANSSVTGGDANGATKSGNVGITWSFSTTITPDAGYEWSDGSTAARAFPTNGAFANQANDTAGYTFDSIVQSATDATSGTITAPFTNLPGEETTGGAYSFNVSSVNNDGAYVVVAGQSWITIVSGASGTTSGSGTFDLALNGGSSQRSANLILRNGNGDQLDTVRITQGIGF